METASYSLPDQLSSIVEQATGKKVRIVRANTEGADYAFNGFILRENKDENITEVIEAARARIAANLPEGVILSTKGTFLNFNIPNTLLATTASSISEKPDGAITAQGKRIMVEFCSPNTNKPLHLGHVRNISIGKSLAAVFKFLGNDVISANVTNDRGVHICKSMLAYQLFGNGETPESTDKKGDHFVGDYYVQYEKALQKEMAPIIARMKDEEPALTAKINALEVKIEALESQIEEIPEEDEEEIAKLMDQKKKIKKEKDKLEEPMKDAAEKETQLGSEVNKMLKKWESGDPEIRALWAQMNAWVYKGFAETLNRLRTSFDANYFESDIYQMGAEIVQKGLAEGILNRDESDAVIADLAKLKIKKEGKKVLLRPNGTTVYMTQDLALAKLKAEEHKLDKSIYVVADEQNDHFKVLFGILEALGYAWAKKGNLEHASYGMVNLPHGRMKSREGTTVEADNLLDELQKGASAKAAEKENVIDDRIADIIGKAALQFYLLSAKAETTLHYNPKKSLKFEGKTGPYVLYQYVRSGKILQKAAQAETNKEEPDFSLLTNPFEHQLLLKLVEFSDMIRILQRNPGSIAITDYVYDLAKTFSLFYENCRVLNAETPELKTVRVALAKYTHTLIGQSLDLLGIEKLESM